MTIEDFEYGLSACGFLWYKDGNTYYEHNELIECFKDLGFINEEKEVEMGMTIDGAIKYYSNKNVVRTAEEAEANTIALNTMRKYQKILEIYERFQKDGNYYHYMAWLDVMEVIEDGND